MSRELAKEIIKSLGATRMPVTSISAQTGISVQILKRMIGRMRERGEIPPAPTRKLIAENGTLTLEFTGPKHAADEGFEISAVKKCLGGTRKTHAGFTWRYEVVNETTN